MTRRADQSWHSQALSEHVLGDCRANVALSSGMVVCRLPEGQTIIPFKAYCWTERHSGRMSEITNDGLTRSGTGCFIAVPIWQQ